MTRVDADRWLEIDLYWFDKGDIVRSVEEFWQRFEPLMRDVSGWLGVIVNAGWLADHVLAWEGDLTADIPFPEGLGKDKFFDDAKPLTGSLEERKAGWRERFGQRGVRDTSYYEAWTYQDLAHLASSLRDCARELHDLENVRVGTFVIGWDSIYNCEPSAWSKRHPEAFFEGPWIDRLFNVVARLGADPKPTAAFPRGLEAGLPITTYFGKQWGHLAQAVGLDAIVLRDSMIGQGIYERHGPFGITGPDDPALVQEWSNATASLIRETKLAAPQALVIGYSNGASAVADWRVNCVDLEAIGHEGFLDAWIDQTWAGAWNEVGQREGLFWNFPLQGYTNQLGFVLLRAAELAETPVRHYVLTETFDAWESWDIIHTAPDRLRWSIWAYLHAMLVTPDGLKAPRGTYVSWLNQGKRLLTEDDVGFLRSEINAATVDARGTTEVFGPTAVYNRPAMAWQNAHHPEVDAKEWIDEQIGYLAKFSVPISSVTRGEYLAGVSSDYLLVQTPRHLPEDQTQLLLDRVASGKPTMVTGAPGNGYDPRIAEAIGLIGSGARSGDVHDVATRGQAADTDVPDEFAIVHRWSETTAGPNVEVLYSVGGSPAFVRDGHVSAWDPADAVRRLVKWTADKRYWADPYDRSILELMGSAYPFMIPAREINRVLAENGSISVGPIAPDSPIAVAAWRSGGGTIRVLIGEVEEGFRDSTDGVWETEVAVPQADTRIAVRLVYGQTALFDIGSETARDRWSVVRVDPAGELHA